MEGKVGAGRWGGNGCGMTTLGVLGKRVKLFWGSKWLCELFVYVAK